MNTQTEKSEPSLEEKQVLKPVSMPVTVPTKIEVRSSAGKAAAALQRTTSKKERS